MGRIAVQMLLEAIESGQDQAKPLQVMLEPRLVVRSSCGAYGRFDRRGQSEEKF
jgi:DNA-binding LacI/PurR family transcriptional regulator